MHSRNNFKIPIPTNFRAGHKCPGRAGRPGSLGVAGRGSLISTGVADRGARVGDPQRPCHTGPARVTAPHLPCPGHSASPALPGSQRLTCLAFSRRQLPRSGFVGAQLVGGLRRRGPSRRAAAGGTESGDARRGSGRQPLRRVLVVLQGVRATLPFSCGRGDGADQADGEARAHSAQALDKGSQSLILNHQLGAVLYFDSSVRARAGPLAHATNSHMSL